MKTFYFLAFFLSVGASASSVHALDGRGSVPSISPGQSIEEVRALWGEPRERYEYESRREDVWVYDGREVLFNEGRVKSWRIGVNDGVAGLPGQKAKPTTTPSPNGSGRRSADSVAAQEILSEIMREPPSSAEPEASTGQAPNAVPVEIIEPPIVQAPPQQ